MTPLERITERVNRHGDCNDDTTPRPLLTLDEFFDGNDVVGSIGCNLPAMPAPAAMAAALKTIAARPDVAQVRVQVTLFDDPEWPFSDTVWVITTAAPDDVRGWFDEALRPDECFAGWTKGVAFEKCPVPIGFTPIACWWD